MKTRILLLIACALGAFYATGCMSSAGSTIEASSTRFEIRNGKNKGMAIVLPKEMDAADLDLKIDPKTGQLSLKASKLKSSSAQIIESAGAAQAQAIASLSSTVEKIVPVITKAAAAVLMPQNAAATAAADVVAAPADTPAPAEPAK